MANEQATLGAGCFWHVQWTFDHVIEVASTLAGYAGGKGKADYSNAEEAGFAEVVQINFDSRKISYEKILDIFWREHDPTLVDMQGADIGHRYRSVIFYHNNEQKKIAEKSKKDYQKKLGKPIVTEIKPLKNFWPAEEKHQKYLEKMG